MNKKRYFTMAVVLLIGAALVGLAGWGYTRSAVASPGREQAEGRSIKARNHSHDWLYRLRGERHRFFRFDDGEESRGDRDDSTPTTGGVTPPTTAGTTTTTVQTTTTTTQATTTTTQATTTTTVRPTTTTTQATTTTTAINGGALFATTCRGCHGAGGTPISSTLTASQVLTKITTGSMSGYASGLSSAQKSAVATYVAGGGR